MKPLDTAISQADYLARKASKRLLVYLEEIGVEDPNLRKTVLDAVNDFKRDLMRFVYEVNE